MLRPRGGTESGSWNTPAGCGWSRSSRRPDGTWCVPKSDPREKDAEGHPKVSRWAFVSSLPLPRDRLQARRAALAISRIGRSRWHIENHVFQALKSRSGIHLGRTFGHGKGHLWSVFACLMILAFAIDPLQALGSRMFQAAWAKVDHTISVLWDDLRNALKSSAIYSWEMLFRLLALPGRSATSEHRPGPP